MTWTAADRVAARLDATTIMTRMTGPIGGRMRFHVPPQDWHRAVLDRHNTAVRDGRGLSCPHSGQPQPLFAAAWRPGRTACGPCAVTMLLPVDDVENWTCDRCSQHLPGKIAPSALQSGWFIIFVGLCPGCRRD